jgi:hypothetical protein
VDPCKVGSQIWSLKTSVDKLRQLKPFLSYHLWCWWESTTPPGRFQTSEHGYKTTEIVFVRVVLMKVLQTAEYPERVGWIEQFKDIKMGFDAAIFMNEAKLKLNYSIDLKKVSPGGRRYN